MYYPIHSFPFSSQVNYGGKIVAMHNSVYCSFPLVDIDGDCILCTTLYILSPVDLGTKRT